MPLCLIKYIQFNSLCFSNFQIIVNHLLFQNLFYSFIHQFPTFLTLINYKLNEKEVQRRIRYLDLVIIIIKYILKYSFFLYKKVIVMEEITNFKFELYFYH